MLNNLKTDVIQPSGITEQSLREFEIRGLFVIGCYGII